MGEAKRYSPSFAVVSESETKAVPYPYVCVNEDGSVRELHQSERTYLETPFNPFDGARPYIKNSFEQKNGWGTIGGFCPRVKIPPNIAISDAPLDDPSENSNKIFLERQIKFAKEKGLEIIENADGSIIIKRPKRK